MNQLTLDARQEELNQGVSRNGNALTIFDPPRNVWKCAIADTAAILIDASSYFASLREALLRADHTVYIAGWDVDTRTPLRSEVKAADDDLPDVLGPFLAELVKRKPDLRIKILLWDYSLVYAGERELLPELRPLWMTSHQIDLCLDDQVPLGSSHHQKFVVIDQSIAFCGGIDLTIRRWDTPEHLPYHPDRVDPAGIPYAPFHDVQVGMTGEAAASLAELFQSRWHQAARETFHHPRDTIVSGSEFPWRKYTDQIFHSVVFAVSRTVPNFLGSQAIHEVEELFIDLIGTAEVSIYIESQYLTFATFAEALAKRLSEIPKLQALIVCPSCYHGWTEDMIMCAGRARFREILEAAGVSERVTIARPCVMEGDQAIEIKVHAKVMIVDDKYLRIGSANLSKRSMGADTECDITIASAGRKDHELGIVRVRNRLLAEHCGASTEEIEQAFDDTQLLTEVLRKFSERRYRLLPITENMSDLARWEVAAGFLDPLEPIDPIGHITFLEKDGIRETPTKLPADHAQGGRRQHKSGRKGSAMPYGLLLLGGAAVIMALCWVYTPLADLTDLSLWQQWLADIRGPWEMLIVALIFVAAGFVAFPVVVLIACTAVVFGAWPGSAYAAVGALTSAMATYALGRWIGSHSLRSYLGPRLNHVNETLQSSGIMTVTIARLVPAAPYTVVNLAAGALHVNLLHYFIGTALGLAPGILVMSILGHHITAVFSHPTWFNISLSIGLFLGSIVLALGIQRLISRLRYYFR